MRDRSDDAIDHPRRDAGSGPPGASQIWLAWHLLALLLLTFAPGQIWLDEPVWNSDPERLITVLGVVAAYSVGGLLLPRFLQGRAPGHSVFAFALAISPLAFVYLLMLVSNLSYSRGVLLIGAALYGFLIVVPLVFVRHLAPTGVLACCVFAVVGLGIVGRDPAELTREAMPSSRSEVIVTNRHVIRATLYPRFVETGNGGGLAHIDEDLLLVTGDGDFWRISLSGDQIAREPLNLHAPLNRDAFLAAVTDATVRQNYDYFRVAGLLVQPLGDNRKRLVVSHHYWKPVEECFVLRFSELIVDDAQLLPPAPETVGASPSWRTLHETRPCLPLKDQRPLFSGHESGGRIAALGDTALVVTVGDHAFDGLQSERALAQSMDNDYGKTLILPLDAPARVFTLGHRNPQGLLVTPTGEIWLTEHGPEGGDELNLLLDGANYGWPLQTYGTEYGELDWPLAVESGADSAFTYPEFAWVPSVGLSNLITLEGGAFPQWKDDFLVASVGSQRLYRLHREAGRFAYSEPILIGWEIRDLIELADGRVVLWGDQGNLVTLTSADPEE